ncbi:MAG: transposase [Sphingosinicella sp.]
MARVIPCEETASIELGELIEALNCDRFDPADEESFAACAPMLRRLANNRFFLAELAVSELKDRCGRQSLENRYSSQVIMVHRASDKFFIRANFWPSPRDSVFKASGTSPFFYYLPHDHNFSFLTVGYLGPGYWSDYYEYDYERVTGLPGEKVELRFIEKSRLEPGKVMLYRAHRDVHNQLPADEMSVSINIMEASNRLPFLDQYGFDVEKGEIAGILTRSASEALLALAAHHGAGTGGGNARDLVECFAAGHPSERIRFAAMRELASAESDRETGRERLARGAGDASAFVAAMCARELKVWDQGRSWIENAPPA